MIIIFGLAMGYFEATVVVYLRDLYYPDGFSFPLVMIPTRMITIELFRELSTIVMIAAVAIIAGKKLWERFGFFLIPFGIWDIFYYVWLRISINWPLSMFDWDVLFLIPIPWIGPVIAPILIALLMIIFGFKITGLFAQGINFKPTLASWTLSIIGTVLILYSFMRDTDATISQMMPQPYLYSFLIAGLILYLIAFIHAYRRSLR
jgi:hypothetical protein